MYKNATTSYLFKGENSSYNGCYDGTNDFIYAADFLVTWMRPNITKFGCAVYECGLYNYLFACSFWPQPENKSVPLFTNENFLSLCKTERGLGSAGGGGFGYPSSMHCWFSALRQLRHKPRSVLHSDRKFSLVNSGTLLFS